jgi:hypothetical protein
MKKDTETGIDRERDKNTDRGSDRDRGTTYFDTPPYVTSLYVLSACQSL